LLKYFIKIYIINKLRGVDYFFGLLEMFVSYLWVLGLDCTNF